MASKHFLVGPHKVTINGAPAWNASCACGNFMFIFASTKKQAEKQINKHIAEKKGGV